MLMTITAPPHDQQHSQEGRPQIKIVAMKDCIDINFFFSINLCAKTYHDNT